MLRSVFAKTVRDQRRALLWWALGLLLLSLLTFLSYPAVRDAPELNRLLEDLPEAVSAFVGESDLVSPPGYLNSQLFTFMVPLLFLIYAIGLGAGSVAGEEERGTLDLLLAQPISRESVVLQKFGGIAVVLGALALAFWLELWLGARLVAMEIGAGRLLAGTFSALLLALLFAALALALGCLTGSRGISVGLTAAVGVGAYLLNAFAPLAEWLEPYRGLSAFYYYIGGDPIRNGLSTGHALVLTMSTVALVGIGMVAFRRRDVAV